MALLEIHDLHTFFKTKKGIVKAVNGVSYSVEPGKTLGVVGESGSGKSVSAMSILKLLDGNGYIDSGEIIFDGKNLADVSVKDMCKIRGNEISVIFQEPMTSLNPIFTVERQLSEPFIIHQGMNKKEAAEKVVEMLKDVRIPNPEAVAKQYPHQLSGGMRQRVMIAMALACRPKLLIADEPTTALDVTIQAQILKLMNDLKKEKGTSILFITHDLGVINEMADDVAVMYCGQVVEKAPVRSIFGDNSYLHPYTEGLLYSIPRLDTPTGIRLEAIPGAVPHPLDLPKGCKFAPRCKYATDKCREMEPELNKVLLRVSNLKQYFPIGKKKMGKPQSFVKANDGISLNIYEGETFGLVGESGCGKSTFGRTLLQLYRQTGGRTVYYGRTVEDFDLKYVEEIFRNLPDKKKKCEELLDKVKKLEADYAKMPEGTEEEKIAKKAAGQHLAEMESEANNDLLDITALIGGLYTLDESALAEAGRHYLAEYLAMKEIRKINAQAEDFEKNGKSAKAEEVKKKIPELQKKVQAELAEIDKIRDNCKKDEAFDKYEAQKDDGINLANLTDAEMRYLRRDLQLIFQDPYSSLNPRMTVGQIIGEGLMAHNIFKKGDPKMQDYIMEIMEKCGLASYFIHRYPHQFSGGQRQRIGIARSLAVNPKFVVCDEAVSALDVSIQSQIINLLLDLKEQNNLTYLFISHDLSVIKYISDRIGVMYLGNMMELSDTEHLFAHPYHPYTEALLSAIPTTDVDGKKETIILEGDIPSPINPPKGCKFHTRCRYCTEICKNVTPQFEEVEPGHFVACHHKLGVPEEK